MRLDSLIEWYETLSPESLSDITEIYHEHASFQDPFNDVQGLEAISNIFRHMFENTHKPRFWIISSEAQGDVAWLTWQFEFVLANRQHSIAGASRLLFSEDGRVTQHRDYWDATELFAKLPIVGTITRHLKKRLGTTHYKPRAFTANL